MKTITLYFATAIAEIVGCYLPWLWLKQNGISVVADTRRSQSGGLRVATDTARSCHRTRLRSLRGCLHLCSYSLAMGRRGHPTIELGCRGCCRGPAGYEHHCLSTALGTDPQFGECFEKSALLADLGTVFTGAQRDSYPFDANQCAPCTWRAPRLPTGPTSLEA